MNKIMTSLSVRCDTKKNRIAFRAEICLRNCPASSYEENMTKVDSKRNSFTLRQTATYNFFRVSTVKSISFLGSVSY